MVFKKLNQPGRLLAAIIVFVLGAVFSVTLSAAPLDRTNAVWVLTEHSGILKLNQSDAALQKSIDTLPADAEALAVDNARFLIWVATKDRNLHAYSIDGVLQFSVPIPANVTVEDIDEHHDVDLDEDLDHAAMVVNEVDGSVFLAEKKALYKFNAAGAMVGAWPMERKVRSLDFDQARQILWVVTKKGVGAYNPQAIPLHYIDLSHKNAVRDVDVDQSTGELWVGIKKELRRYSATGALVLSVAVEHITYLAATGNGNVWVNTKKQLKLYSAAGILLKTIDPFAGKGRLEDLAANTANHSAWLLDKKAVVHVSANGTLLNISNWTGAELEMLKLSFDRIAPSITITSPADASVVSPTTAVNLSYSDQGSGIDTVSIKFTVNDQAATFACTHTATAQTNFATKAGTAVCTPSAPYSTAAIKISVNAKDHAGNAAPTQTINVKLDTDGDGYADDVDAFPKDPNEWSDLDGDGIGDNSDLDKDGDGYPNDKDAFPKDVKEWKDTDSDGVGDNSDPDIDGDGHNNDVDAFPLDATEWSDLDGDGIGDNSDPDKDNDGYANDQDVFPENPTEWADLDGDGIGNNSDPDKDGDGVANNEDVFPDDANRWKLPVVKITAPTTLITVGASPINLTGTIDDVDATITVNGQPVPNNAGGFAAQVSLVEGFNTVVARAVDAKGSEATASIVVTLDATPPHVTIQSPKEGETVTNASITVTGLVNDIVRGTVAEDQAIVIVNGIAASVSNRSYMAENVPLQPGANTLTVTASDKVGNTETYTRVITYTPLTGSKILLSSGSGQTANIISTLLQPLTVKVVNEQGIAIAGKEVIFRVIEGDGVVGTGATTDQRAYAANTDANGLASTKFRLGSRSGQGNHKVRATAVGINGEAVFHATAVPSAGDKISVQSGNNQRGAILSQLPRPFVVSVTDQGGNAVQGAEVTFTITKGTGQFQNNLNTLTVLTDSDGRATAHMTVGREEGLDIYRVSASLKGTIATAGFTASALLPGDPGNTIVTGVVFDNQDTPLPNVTIRVEGTTREAQSNAQGQFEITQVPVGPLRLMVEGQTTSVPGDWPTLSYDIVTIAGATNTLPAPIYLVPLNNKNAKVVGSEDVTITLDEVPGFALTVKAGSVTFPDGSKTGKLSVTTVNSSKVPMAPPNGMQPQFIVTIQPAGAKFDPPAKLTLPNVDANKPGAQVEMYSYDHDLEEFVTIGWGTVAEDGKTISSNDGVGVIKAGWHCGSSPDKHGCTSGCSICNTCPGNEKCNCNPDFNDPRALKNDSCCVPGPVDPATGKITSLNVPNHPIQNLNECPKRVSNKDHVPAHNGCGGAGSALAKVIPDNPTWEYYYYIAQSNNGIIGQIHMLRYPNSGHASFLSACNAHDTCFDSCNSSGSGVNDKEHKDGCDNNFLNGNNAICDASYQGSIIANVFNGQCKIFAAQYYAAVSRLKSFYEKAQKQACSCCRP